MSVFIYPYRSSRRQSLINSEIAEITHKIEALDAIRVKLEQDLLKLQEDELELDDECNHLISSPPIRFSFCLVEGVKERLRFEQQQSSTQTLEHFPQTSRRRRGVFSQLNNCLVSIWST